MDNLGLKIAMPELHILTVLIRNHIYYHRQYGEEIENKKMRHYTKKLRDLLCKAIFWHNVIKAEN